METAKKILILTGMKHTGKSTVGKLLAERCQLPFFDTDDVIKSLSGLSARELYQRGGQILMQEWETRACEYIVEKLSGAGAIVATGGGISDNPAACALLAAAGRFAYLDTDFETVYARVLESARLDQEMPAFLTGPDPEQNFRILFHRRTETYAKMADIRVKTGTMGPAAVAQTVLGYLQDE